MDWFSADVWLYDPADTSITKYCIDSQYRNRFRDADNTNMSTNFMYSRQRLMCVRLFGSIQKVSSVDIPFEGLSDKQIIHIIFEDIGEVPVHKKTRLITIMSQPINLIYLI